MGAWIETVIFAACEIALPSHPTWVRGLKLLSVAKVAIIFMSHPTWVRGLKHDLSIICFLLQSRTLRGCVD